MTFKDLLTTICTDHFVDVYTSDKDYKGLQAYIISWHYKELLNLPVKSIWSENNKLSVYLGE